MSEAATWLDEDVAKDFGRALTLEVAPEEVPFYDELVAASRKASRLAEDRPLGFGVETLIESAVSVALFQISKLVLDFVWEHAKDAAGQALKQLGTEAARHVVKQFKSWLHRGFYSQAPVMLSEASLDELLQAVDAEATRQQISDELKIKVRAKIEQALSAKTSRSMSA